MIRPLVLVLILFSSAGKLPIDDLSADLHHLAGEVQKAWNQYPDNACVLYEVASLYARAGHTNEAIAVLRDMARKHAGLDPRVLDGFQNVAANPEFLKIKAAIRAENPPALHARPAFTIAEADLMTEGIAWSEKRQRFYLGSAKRKIIEVDATGHARDFVAPASDGLGVLVGLRVDDERGELWAASEQFTPKPGLVRGVFRFRLSDGKLLAKYPVRAGEADLVNDLVVAPDGTLYATASDSGSLIRIERGHAEAEIFLPPHALPDPNGITASADGRYLFVAGWYGITRVDPRTRQTLLLKSSAQIAAGCLDGLYEHRGDLIGIQNCVHDTGRVLRLHLNEERDTIVSLQVLESYNPLFDGMTTGAIAGTRFYFMANTQLHKMKADGSVLSGTKFDPIKVLALDLDKVRH